MVNLTNMWRAWQKDDESLTATVVNNSRPYEFKRLPSTEIWLEDYIEPLRRESTYERYQDIIKKYIWPEIGNLPIDQVKRGDIRNLILKQQKAGLSRSTLCLMRDVVSGPFAYAIDEELLQANPVLGIMKRLKLDRERKLSVEPLNYEEVELFLSTCSLHAPEWYEFFLASFRTGMRLGETLALHWEDIDWNGKFIHVQRSFKRGRIEKTKTGKTRRVDMPDQLSQVLRQLLTERKRAALKQGRGEHSKIVFHTKDGYTAQNSIRNVFKRILRKAGLREIRVHDMRHTFASLLLSNGESPVRERTAGAFLNKYHGGYLRALDSQQQPRCRQPT